MIGASFNACLRALHVRADQNKLRALYIEPTPTVRLPDDLARWRVERWRVAPESPSGLMVDLRERTRELGTKGRVKCVDLAVVEIVEGESE